MKKVLIVDDDQDISYILDMVLSPNYQTMIVTDVAKIIDAYAQFVPDLLIIDNFIAHRRASEVITELKFLGGGQSAPFILFSAASNIEQLAREMSASAFLPKPFQLSELLSAVRAVLEADSKVTSGRNGRTDHFDGERRAGTMED